MVQFKINIKESEKSTLLKNALCLLYTPTEEHFGIVPCEAMIQGVPVIAIDNGGPKETIAHGETGYLIENDAAKWSEYMSKFVTEAETQLKMRDKCIQRILDKFEFLAFSKNVGQIFNSFESKKLI